MPESQHRRHVRISIESRNESADGGASGSRLWTGYFLTQDCGGLWDRRRLTIEGA
jgi:hypothetical protein